MDSWATSAWQSSLPGGEGEVHPLALKALGLKALGTWTYRDERASPADFPIMGLTSLLRGVVYQHLILACLMGMERHLCKGEGKFL